MDNTDKKKKKSKPFLLLSKNHHKKSISKLFPEDGKVFLTEVQNVIGSILFCQKYLKWPRWLQIFNPKRISHIVLVTWDNMTYEDVADTLNENSSNSACKLDKFIKVYSTFSYNYTPEQELFLVPFTALSDTFWNAIAMCETINVKPPRRCKRSKYHFSSNTIKSNKKRSIQSEPNSSEPMGERTPNPKRRERFSRTLLLMSVEQMIEERYPLPNDPNTKYADFENSFPAYSPVTEKSPLYGVDCEMVLTTVGYLELARITVVDEDFTILYDELIKPLNRIVNYLTRYSGITRTMLDPVTKTVDDMREDLRELLPADSIFVGHSLGSDLTAMKMFHPYVVDTSVIYNMSGQRKRKCALRFLTRHFLGRSIQRREMLGHCSAEDSIATLELLKLKLSKDEKFGDAVAGGSMEMADDEEEEEVDEEPPTKCTKLDDQQSGDVLSLEEKCASHKKLLDKSQYPLGTHLLDVFTQYEVKSSLVTSSEIEDSDRRQWHWVEEMGCVDVFDVTGGCQEAISTAAESVVDGSKFCFLRLAKCHPDSIREQMDSLHSQLPTHSLMLFLFPGDAEQPDKEGICYAELKY